VTGSPSAGAARPGAPGDRGPQPAPAAAAPVRRPGTAPQPPTGQRQGRSGMMTQRAWPLSSDPAGVGTAMIASGAVPAPLPAHIGVSQTSQITTQSGLCRHPGGKTRPPITENSAPLPPRLPRGPIDRCGAQGQPAPPKPPPPGLPPSGNTSQVWSTRQESPYSVQRITAGGVGRRLPQKSGMGMTPFF
jgi:hypothetical protein